MAISRMDLDGKGSGSPEGIVALILKQEPLVAPVPIEALAHALDIVEIAELSTEGFEGALLTDRYRSKGSILVRKPDSDDLGSEGRRRFTIGHELGHFLIPSHKPVRGDQFLCDREAMQTWSATEQNTYARMEIEANKFAALILMPPRLMRRFLSASGDPKLERILDVQSHFKVSKDSAARAYAQHHEEPISIVVVHNGKILRIYKNSRFPKMAAGAGDHVPKPSIYHRIASDGPKLSDVGEASAGQWLESHWGTRQPTLYEQTLIQAHGYALILLWAELHADEELDSDENLTAKQRLERRVRRWAR